jgi:hypothetical protein
MNAQRQCYANPRTIFEIRGGGGEQICNFKAEIEAEAEAEAEAETARRGE